MLCSPRALPLFILCVSLGALVTAFVAQYGFGMYPCELCIWQRIPYAITAFLATLALFIPNRMVIIIMCCVLVFLGQFALALYHVGVEEHIVTGTSSCSATISSADTLDDLRDQIMQSPLIACDQPAVRFIGLSMAGWNALAALLFATITYYTIYRIKRKTDA